jgi:hypothetical protein
MKIKYSVITESEGTGQNSKTKEIENVKIESDSTKYYVLAFP